MSFQTLKTFIQWWNLRAFCTTSLNRAQSGRDIISTLRKLLTASTGTVVWRILHGYGIPQQIILLIKCFHTNYTCKLGSSNPSFKVMSAMLFNMTIDWAMQQTTKYQPRGIRWTLFSTLEHLPVLHMFCYTCFKVALSFAALICVLSVVMQVLFFFIHSQKKGTKAVTGAVPFQKVHFSTQRLHIGTLVVHISTWNVHIST